MSNHKFIEITNEDIYQEIKGLRNELNRVCRKVAIAQWSAAIAVTLSLVGIGAVIT